MRPAIEERHTTMDDDTLLPFDLPAVARKKVTAAFYGRRLTSDGWVLCCAALSGGFVSPSVWPDVSWFGANFSDRS